MVIFPLAPDQTIAQMWSNGVWGPICHRPPLARQWNKCVYTVTTHLSHSRQWFSI